MKGNNTITGSGLRAVFLERRTVIIRLLTARLGNADEAEEVAQDLWIKLERNPAGPVAEPAAYLFKMANNLATDRRVAGRRGQARDSHWVDLQPTDVEIPSIEREVLGRDALACIGVVIADMPERMRTALIQFRLEGLAQREIAANLGITVSGVEKLLARAYHLLAAENELGADSAPQHSLRTEREPEQ